MVIVTKLNDDSTQATSRAHLENDRRSLAPPSYETISSFNPVSPDGSDTIQMAWRTTRPILIQDYYDNLSVARAAPPAPRSPSSSLAALTSLRPTQSIILRLLTCSRKKRRLVALLLGTVLLSTAVLLVIGRHQGWSTQLWRIRHGVSKPIATRPQQADGHVVKQFSTTDHNWTRVLSKSDSGVTVRQIYTYQLMLDLPLREARGYYFIFRGSSSGDIHINEGAPADVIRVNITAQYWDEDRITWGYEHGPLIKMASAYLLERHMNETGVGLYLPIADRRPDIDVEITVPRSQERVTRLRSLQIDAEELHARFRLRDSVAIDNLTVAAYAVHSKAAFETSSSNVLAYYDVDGQYSARNELRLEVSWLFGTLRADSFLGRGSSAGSTPSLELKTTGTIGGSVALLDATSFRVRINGQQRPGDRDMHYAVDSLPANAILDLEAWSGFGVMELRLPPTYEGSLDLCKSELDADPIRVAQGLRDPTGAEAEHIISADWSDDRRWRGSVGWGSDSGRRGSVRLLSPSHNHCRLSIS